MYPTMTTVVVSLNIMTITITIILIFTSTIDGEKKKKGRGMIARVQRDGVLEVPHDQSRKLENTLVVRIECRYYYCYYY